MNFQSKISKEELNEMPIKAFEGTIIVIDKDQNVADAIAAISKNKIVGIDTETKPSFRKGVYNRVALLQVATDEVCWLFRLNKISIDADESIFNFLTNKKIIKIGLSLKDDFARLRTISYDRPANIIDLQTIAKQFGILELGLQKMYAIVFRQKISKSQQLTNWENATLSEPQKRYAATDAWAALQIYKRLKKAKPLPKQQVEQLVAAELSELQELSRKNTLTQQKRNKENAQQIVKNPVEIFDDRQTE